MTGLTPHQIQQIKNSALNRIGDKGIFFFFFFFQISTTL